MQVLGIRDGDGTPLREIKLDQGNLSALAFEIALAFFVRQQQKKRILLTISRRNHTKEHWRISCNRESEGPSFSIQHGEPQEGESSLQWGEIPFEGSTFALLRAKLRDIFKCAIAQYHSSGKQPDNVVESHDKN